MTCDMCEHYQVKFTGKKLELQVLIYKESSFNLRDAGSHVTDRSPVVGMLFCIGLLTVGSRLCMFCSLHFRTLRDHCHATVRNIRIFKLSHVLLTFVVSRVCFTACLIVPAFFCFGSLFSITASIYTFWLAIFPKIFCGPHWRWIWGLAAVMDLLVSTKPFCLPKCDLISLSLCLVCSHAAKFGPPLSHHVSPVLGVVGGGTFCEAMNQVSQFGHIFSVIWY